MKTTLQLRFFKALMITMLGLFFNGAWAQTTVTYSAMTTITCPATPVATISTPPAGLTFSQISRGSGVNCTTAGGSITGSGFNGSLATNLSSEKFYTFSITSNSSVTFTLNSLNIVSRVSSAGGSPNVSVQYSIGNGAKSVIGSFVPTGNAATYTITPSSAISVGANQVLNIYIVPNSLTAAGTTCRVENNTSANVTATASTNPAVSTNGTESLSFSNTNVAGFSANSTFDLSGSSLTGAPGSIVVTAPNANFQVSNNGTDWASTAAINYASSTLSNTQVYVRFSPQSAGAKTGNLTFSGGGVTDAPIIALSGTGIFPAPIANDATLISSAGFTANWSTVNTATSYALDVYSTISGPPATDLFISEYVEGSSSNKAIEIYNGTGVPVDLSNYSLRKQSNGSGSYTGNLALSGTLNNGETYIIANSSASSTILDLADLTSGNSPMDFNGNDAVALFKNGIQIDEVGVFNQVASWGTDVTLRRKSSITSPATTYNVANWDSFSTDTFSGLGSHTFDSGATNVYAIQNQNVGNVTSYPVSGLTQGTAYHYVVRAVSGSDISLNSNVINVTTVSTTTTWDGTSWSNGTPTSSLDAIIAGNYSTGTASPQGPFTAKSLTVNSGIFTVASATSVTVENAIVNNADSNNFIVENNANLIQNTAATNTGAIKVKRTSNPLYRFDYTLWSSPVVGQNLKAFSSATLSNRFYTYNTATGANGDYVAVFPTQSEGTYSFEAGKGYLIRTPDSHPAYVEGNLGTAINAEFTGTPYNQNVNVALSAVNTGFNLVGNPYPSAISISQLFTLNSNAIDGTIWFWRKRNGASGSGYATSTGMGVTSAQPEAAALNPNGVIGAGQGFFVKVKSAPTQTTLNFDNTLRSSVTGGSFFRNSNASSDEVERHRIWLNLSNGSEVIGQTLLGYMTGATAGVDYGIEGKYFNDSPIAFTSYLENQEFAIQGRSLPFTTEDVVPMSFKTDVAGNYSITIDHVDGLFAGSQDIFLKDNFTGQIHNIKASGYSFATEAGVFNNRFEIAYRSLLGVDVPTIAANNIVVYKQNGSLVINSGAYIMNKIELYDISGRLVYSRNNVDAATAVISNLAIANQVLVVKITTAENGTANKKIVY